MLLPLQALGDNQDVTAVVDAIPLIRDDQGAYRVVGTRVTLDVIVRAFGRGPTVECANYHVESHTSTNDAICALVVSDQWNCVNDGGHILIVAQRLQRKQHPPITGAGRSAQNVQ